MLNSLVRSFGSELVPVQASRGQTAPLSDEDFNAWRVCWRVNAAFSTKASQFDHGRSTWCLKCGKTIAPNTFEYRSSFVSRVVESSCQHLRIGDLCSECDTDIVFKITRLGEKCFVKGCDQTLHVDTAQVSSILRGLPKLQVE